MTDVPFTTFNDPLKFIRTDALSHDQRLAMSLAFRGFFVEQAQNPRDVERYERRKSEESRIRVELQQPFNYRRFAGGSELPRSRYYSVCADHTGNDHQTLSSELTAYIEPSESGEVYTVDLSDPAYAARRQHYTTLWPDEWQL